jgi:hypothetical protein
MVPRDFSTLVFFCQTAPPYNNIHAHELFPFFCIIFVELFDYFGASLVSKSTVFAVGWFFWSACGYHLF